MAVFESIRYILVSIRHTCIQSSFWNPGVIHPAVIHRGVIHPAVIHPVVSNPGAKHISMYQIKLSYIYVCIKSKCHTYMYVSNQVVIHICINSRCHTIYIYVCIKSRCHINKSNQVPLFSISVSFCIRICAALANLHIRN